MSKFNPGDRVIAKGIMSDIDITGLLGSVIVEDFLFDGREHAIGVRFDEFEGGHTLEERLPRGSHDGYWVYPKLLKLANKKFKVKDLVLVGGKETLVVEIGHDGVRIEDSTFHKNNRVKLIGRKALI